MRLRTQSGFSLVELMVVVAIIGILAAIAVPNFQRFTAKSKQSEAKSNLSALYSAERAFQAEWQTFDARFTVVGYAPVGNLRYAHGFNADFHTVPANYNGPAGIATEFNTGNTAAGANYCAIAGAGCTVIVVPVQPALPAAAAVAAATTFIAEANGDIDGDAGMDTWQINHLKALANTTSDL